jgi:hypothetical protein
MVNKRITLFFVSFILLFGLRPAMAQSNVIKGRIIGLPMPGGIMYTMGAGYERIIKNRFSLQALVNQSGINMSGYDGPNEVYLNVIPELRYYFKTQKKSIFSAFFLSSFLEMQRRTITPGREQDADNYLISNTQTQISPGILIGKNFTSSTRWHLEIYAGPKYRLGNETTEEVINSSPSSSTINFEKFGVRMGFNIGFRF